MYGIILDASAETVKIEGGNGAIRAQVYKNENFQAMNKSSKQLSKHKKIY
jgi:hypothetical protein